MYLVLQKNVKYDRKGKPNIRQLTIKWQSKIKLTYSHGTSTNSQFMQIDFKSSELYSQYKKMFWWRIPNVVVIYDIKTSGPSQKKDRLLEIGAVRLEKYKFLATGEIEYFGCSVKREYADISKSDAEKFISPSFEKILNEKDALIEFFEFAFGSYMFTYGVKKINAFFEAIAKKVGYEIEDECLDLVEDIYNLERKHLGAPPLAERNFSNIARKLKLENYACDDALSSAKVLMHAYVTLKQTEFFTIHGDLLRLFYAMGEKNNLLEATRETFKSMYGAEC